MAGLWDNSIIGARVSLLQNFGVAKNKGRIAFSVENQRWDLRSVEGRTIKLSKCGHDLDDFWWTYHADRIAYEINAFFSLSYPTMISEALVDQMGKPAEFWNTKWGSRRCDQADGLVQNFVG